MVLKQEMGEFGRKKGSLFLAFESLLYLLGVRDHHEVENFLGVHDVLSDSLTL